MEVIPYLHFNGQCAEAFKFYERCLGGKIVATMTYKESPEESAPPEWGDKVMHAYLQVGKSALMGSDSPPGYQEKPQGFSVTLAVDDPAEAERVWNALVEGGTPRMPLAETFWAHRFGMLVDRYGIPWMINCSRPEDAEASKESQVHEVVAG